MKRRSGLTPRTRRRARALGGLAAVVAAIALLLFARPALADKATETAARALQKKAMEDDYLNVDLDKATEHLNQAITKCGTDKCSANLRALLRRDLATVYSAANKKDEALATMVDALKLDSTIQLDANYKTKEIEAIYIAAKKGGGGGSGAATPPSSGGAPSGDFTHTAASEQLIRTPLPIYVEYSGSEAVTKVVVKYKAFGMGEWKTIELKKIDKGWGANLPCADMQQGDVAYYIQGFNANNDPVATGGDRNNAYKTAITKTASGDSLHLPGKQAEKQCADTGDCPPDFPGCSKKVSADTDNLKGADEDCEEDNQCKSGSCVHDKCTKPEEKETPGSGPRLRHWWVGVGVSLDVQFLNGAKDVCILNGSAQPGNPGYYCVDPKGVDYPNTSGTPKGWPAQLQNADILVGKSDQVNGGALLSNLRIFASLDYALNYNLLVGVRFGYTAMDYPGSAYKLFPPLLIEARGTYVIGKEALVTKGFAPVVLLGAGVASFSSSVGVTAFECDTTGQQPAGMSVGKTGSTAVQNQGKPGSGKAGPGEACVGAGTTTGGQSHNVSAWRVNGPIFVAPGGGIRYGINDRAAISLNVKLALAFGSGFLFDPTPEATFQYGF